MKNVFFILLLMCVAHTSKGQFNRHIIYFTNKGFNQHTLSQPLTFLSQRAMDRRTRYNIALDSTDLPITQDYLNAVATVSNVTVLGWSKWLNAVAIRTTDPAALTTIEAMPFVRSVAPVASRPEATPPVRDKFIESTLLPAPLVTAGRTTGVQNDFFDYGSWGGMVQLHRGAFLHNYGFRGQSIQMAFMDAGYFKYLDIPTFDSARLNNRILETWDFVKKETSVNEDHVHGMQCLSTVAAYMPGVFVGTAPEASFYLYRTEEASTEYPIELLYLAAGYERADSAGADVTSTSLGYSRYDHPSFDHTYADMDGNTTIGAIAADMGAKKGMLMVVAAGNEGNGSWRFITTPADADSVLSVGAVSADGQTAGFSSYGPSSDGQIKPTVSAVGWGAAVASHITGEPYPSNGTSFACPNLAGIASCLWQAFPEVNNMELIEALKISAHQYNAPDDRQGFGIPDVQKAFVQLQQQLYNQQFSLNGCFTQMQLQLKQGNGMDVLVERMAPGESGFSLIQIISGSGNFEMRQLSLQDDVRLLPEGTIHYRISMQMGSDTTFLFNDFTVEHIRSCTITSNEVLVYPNPVESDIQIRLALMENAKVRILLVNALGQTLIKQEKTLGPGRILHTLPVQALPKGTYYLNIYLNNKKMYSKPVLK
ncbi:MAG TPA: S8 family serine peptidase [Ferruginibacter sp.]|nr:S8 family serine peptidase [Ferruginibacter sp.]